MTQSTGGHVLVSEETAKARIVAVIGGGRMGSGIVHAFLLAGNHVRLVEVSPEFQDTALARVNKLVEASASRGTLTEGAETVLARLSIHGEIADVAGSDLVIEAVPENLDLKLSVLAAAGDVLGPESLLATNTSSISINRLGVALPAQTRFLGLHFFNPVPASLLVEIVRGAATSEETVTAAREWVECIAKTPIVVSDSPGFASSRLGLALGLEAIRMVESGVATPEDIDQAMVLGYKYPVGPLRLTDIVGLDVRLGIAQYLESELGERFTPPDLLVTMVAEGHLGQKSGQGFYQW